METVAIIVSMFLMFLWLRSEANADRRDINAVIREDRKDVLNMIAAIKEDVLAIRADTAARVRGE